MSIGTDPIGQLEPQTGDGPKDRRRATLLAELAWLQQLGAMFHARGWSLGTSGNYSVVLSRTPFELLITASGKDKSRLDVEDFVVVDDTGIPIGDDFPRPSAETLLHLVIAERPEVRAVLHTHSVWSTILSDWYRAEGGLIIEGYEMLKGLEGVASHEHREWVEIFDNSQDIPKLARRIRARLNDSDHPLRHGFLLHQHGLYTWGRDPAEAQRHVEVFEFLFEVLGRRLTLTSKTGR
jgi:methylthioribulose-1-phosphate dehydratase